MGCREGLCGVFVRLYDLLHLHQSYSNEIELYDWENVSATPAANLCNELPRNIRVPNA